MQRGIGLAYATYNIGQFVVFPEGTIIRYNVNSSDAEDYFPVRPSLLNGFLIKK